MHSVPDSYALDARRVRRNADAAAGTYPAAARLEREVGVRMLERLDYVKLAPRRILDAGCGRSPQAKALAERYGDALLIGLDFSLPMLRGMQPAHLLDRLLGRLSGRAAPLALCADLARIPIAARSFSLVWSNMALHWAADPQAAIREFQRVLEIDGLLMFSTLGPDTLRELRAAFHGSDASPHVHGFIDMHDLGDMLVAAGFAAPVMDTETITLTYAGVEALVADLRSSGQTCALRGRSRGLMSPRRWQRVCEALEHAKRAGRLPCTAEVVYGHAWKAAARRTAEGDAIVDFGRTARK